jgi:hypothetical protein
MLSRKYEVQRKAKALAEGELMHLALGKMYGTRDFHHANAVIDAYQAELSQEPREDAAELATKFEILRNVARIYWEKVAQNDLQVFAIEAIEEPFELEVAPGITLVGYIDGIWRHIPTGVHFIVEHKYKQEHQEELMSLDLQVSTYTLAMLPKYGHLPTLYNVVRKPQLKLGKKETPAEFVARVAEAVTEEMEWAATDIKSRYFVRSMYTRGKRELAVALASVKEMACRMVELQVRPERVIRNVGDQCLYFCPFRDICIEEDPMVVQSRFIERPNGESVKKTEIKI